MTAPSSMSPTSPDTRRGASNPAGQGGTLSGSQFRPDFSAWLLANQAIWLRFCAEAEKVWLRGRRHWSARTIVEYLRHETALQEVGDGMFKINGNYVPDLARLYLLTYPERAELFETRRQCGSARAA